MGKATFTTSFLFRVGKVLTAFYGGNPVPHEPHNTKFVPSVDTPLVCHLWEYRRSANHHLTVVSLFRRKRNGGLAPLAYYMRRRSLDDCTREALKRLAQAEWRFLRDGSIEPGEVHHAVS